jgi:hypothetical protein
MYSYFEMLRICEKPEAQEKLKRMNQQQVKKPSKSVETVKLEEEGVVKLQDPVIPVEDRLIEEAEDDAEEEELPLVIDDEQLNPNEGDTNEELLLESEDADENTDEDDHIAIKDVDGGGGAAAADIADDGAYDSD